MPVLMYKVTKKTAAIVAIWIWAAGYIVTVSVLDYWPLVAGRAVKGFAIGFLSGIIPPYIQECFAEKRIPKILAIFQVFFPAGMFAMATVAYLGCVASFSLLTFNYCWDIMMTLTMPAALLCFFLRPSPNDFLIRGYNAQALEILRDINHEPSLVNKQMTDLITMCRRQAETPKMTFLKDAFKPGNRKRIFLAIFSQMSMQLTGINIISIIVL